VQHVEQLYLTIYKLTWFDRWQSITFSDLSELSDVLDFTFDQGRGTGVGRGLGVGEHLPMHGVGVGVAVAVEVGVAVGVGVGVAPDCTSKEPLSMRPFLTRKKSGPRWSQKGGGVKFGSPVSMAGLPGNNACVNVRPPLSCNGPSSGLVLI
jgi:hypothetical protein